MDHARLIVTAEPDPADLALLEERIIDFNYAVTGLRDGLALAVLLRDAQEALAAGLAGFTWGGACRIEWLWVREDLRGAGIGRELLVQAEQEAARRGCRKMFVSTHSFQAPAFYQRMGYQEVGRWEGFPQGHAEIFLEKTIA